MLQAIVFDFDGILVDSEPLHFAAFREIARPLGVDFDYQQYLSELIGFDDRDAFAHILQRAETRAPLAELCEQKQQAFERLVQRGIDPIAGAMALVDDAAKHMPIAVSSGAVRRDIVPILDQLGRRDAFATIVTADDVARSKPDPQSYALAVQRLAERHPELALQPAHCLAIEDTAAGIESAKAAGLRTLGVTTTHDADELRLADRVITSLEQVGVRALRDWFGGD